ncbi:MAG: J domain-containing protein [Salinibacter sp.]
MPTSDLAQLRRTLARRLKEKAELEKEVRSVQARMEAEVAPLREEVLRLQMERLKEAAQARMRSAKLRNAYHDAQEAYEKFREHRVRTPDPGTRSEEDLKAIYRRATKLCHPDAVPDSYHEEASATFQALESAYDAGRPAAVRAIADVLDKWGFPRPPSAPADASAPSKAALRRAVSTLDTSIERLRTSEAYRTLADAPDADPEDVVGAQKRALQERLVRLSRQRRGRL